jgi:hypothetical protein
MTAILASNFLKGKGLNAVRSMVIVNEMEEKKDGENKILGISQDQAILPMLPKRTHYKHRTLARERRPIENQDDRTGAAARWRSCSLL